MKDVRFILNGSYSKKKRLSGWGRTNVWLVFISSNHRTSRWETLCDCQQLTFEQTNTLFASFIPRWGWKAHIFWGYWASLSKLPASLLAGLSGTAAHAGCIATTNNLPLSLFVSSFLLSCIIDLPFYTFFSLFHPHRNKIWCFPASFDRFFLCKMTRDVSLFLYM